MDAMDLMDGRHSYNNSRQACSREGFWSTVQRIISWIDKNSASSNRRIGTNYFNNEMEETKSKEVKERETEWG